MAIGTVYESAALRVVETDCRAQPDDAPYPEMHASFVVAYVQRGSFGYRTGGRHFDLVAGSLLVGHPGDEYVCTHEHHAGGDACLAFHIAPTLLDELGGPARLGRAAGIPPLAELMLWGERVRAAARGHASAGVDELAIALVARLARLRSGDSAARSRNPSARDRRRAVEAALWIEAHSAESLSLSETASRFGLGAPHFLRLFARTLGVTPHQYLVRTRLRKAGRLLSEGGLSTTEIALRVGFGDLSNFVRTFGRAAGLAPGAFRRAGVGERAAALQRLSDRSSLRSESA